jgi:hypothetical protein
VAGLGKKKEMHTEFLEKSKNQRPLGNLRIGWEGNIKINFKEKIGREEVGCIHMAQDTKK